MGLMQIKHGTARALGYSGPASACSTPRQPDLRRRLPRGAYKTAHGNEAQAYSYYARGYYYAAKRAGIRTDVAELEAPPVREVSAPANPSENSSRTCSAAGRRPRRHRLRRPVGRRPLDGARPTARRRNTSCRRPPPATAGRLGGVPADDGQAQAPSQYQLPDLPEPVVGCRCRRSRPPPGLPRRPRAESRGAALAYAGNAAATPPLPTSGRRSARGRGPRPPARRRRPRRPRRPRWPPRARRSPAEERQARDADAAASPR